jgi:hypothetical protein
MGGSDFIVQDKEQLSQNVRFEVFTAVTMKNGVFWDVAPCRSYVNQCFGGTYRLHLQVEISASEEPA